MAGIMTDKFDKADVDYSIGMTSSHCGKMFDKDVGYCKHFTADSPLFASQSGVCALVKGPIKRGFWCRKFSKAVTK